jgi:hypothetical protein
LLPRFDVSAVKPERGAYLRAGAADQRAHA